LLLLRSALLQSKKLYSFRWKYCTSHCRNGGAAPVANNHGLQFLNQNHKYAIDFGALLYLDGVPIEMMPQTKILCTERGYDMISHREIQTKMVWHCICITHVIVTLALPTRSKVVGLPHGIQRHGIQRQRRLLRRKQTVTWQTTGLRDKERDRLSTFKYTICIFIRHVNVERLQMWLFTPVLTLWRGVLL